MSDLPGPPNQSISSRRGARQPRRDALNASGSMGIAVRIRPAAGNWRARGNVTPKPLDYQCHQTTSCLSR